MGKAEKSTEEKQAEEAIKTAFRLWVSNQKRIGVPEYMATPEAFARRVTVFLWEMIGKGNDRV